MHLLQHKRNYKPVYGSVKPPLTKAQVLPAERRINGCHRTQILDGVDLMPHPCVYGLVKLALEWAGWKTDRTALELNMDEADVVVIACDIVLQRLQMAGK